MDKKVICQKIKELIEKGDVTLAQLARDAKTSVVVIKKLLSGEGIKEDQFNRIEEAVSSYFVKESNKEEVKEETVIDPYMEAVNDIINEESFARALKTILDVREVLKDGGISKQSAVSCANIINRELTEISKAVTKAILNI